MPYFPDAGFDRLAAFYDPLARLVFGRALVRAQRAALAGLPEGAPRVLIIGGGTGWVLGEIWRQRPAAHVCYLEASPRMLARARAWQQRHAPARGAQVAFRLGTEAALLPPEAYDAVLTFFFLDLFDANRLRAVLARLAAVRRPGAPWLLADFRNAAGWWQPALLAFMYRFFRLTTGIGARRLPPIHAELARLGLRQQEQRLFFGGMIAAGTWQ